MTDTYSRTDEMFNAQRSAAERFAQVSGSADLAARSVARGRRASAFAKVMADNGYPDLDMDEVRRLVGE